MFSGFQSNGFQTGFQIVRGGTPPIGPIDTTGGFNEYDYKRYRKYLEQLEQVTSESRKYPKQAIEAAKELQDLPIEIPEITKLTVKPPVEGKLRLYPEINYQLLLQDLEVLRTYLDYIELKRALVLRELDDEAAFLLMIQ